MDTNQHNIIYSESRKGGLLARIVRRCTRWAWKHQVRAIPRLLHEFSRISSPALHDGSVIAEGMINGNKP